MKEKLSIRDLSISFRTPSGVLRAVRGMSLDLFEGETLAIVGESGSGKSVSSKAILGILPPTASVDEGSIMYGGRDLLRMKESELCSVRGGGIAMVFQDPMSSLDPIVKIGTQLTEAMLLKSRERRLQKRRQLRRLVREIARLIKRSGTRSDSKKARELLRSLVEYSSRKMQKSGGRVEFSEDYAKEELTIMLCDAISMERTSLKNGSERGTFVDSDAFNEICGTEHPPLSCAERLIDSVLSLADESCATISRAQAKRRAIELLLSVGIKEPEKRYGQYPFELSGGMRQRIVIAIALATDPDVLICDEPTTALDVTIQAQILELINRLKEERGLSIIFITHDLGVVANIADRVAVMYAGKVLEVGTCEDIFYDPRHPYTWALLSSMPDTDTKEKLESIPGSLPNMYDPPKGDAFAPRNKYAMRIDFEEEPPFFRVSDTHEAATWLLHPSAPRVEMPVLLKARIERRKKGRRVDAND